MNYLEASPWCIADRFLPDKAIDLVDEAAARLKMEATSKPEALDEIERKASLHDGLIPNSIWSCSLLA